VSEVAAIGAWLDVAGFALAGARVYPAADEEQARAAWRDLPEGVGFVILSADAAAALEPWRGAEEGPLTVVMPA
jgi:vacuolar-type H+-ATPase subunit F/Vma7